jgi:predicted ATPase/class 3 adenylate cyclase
VGSLVTVSATAYPTGTVTFLFTDIGGSTRLWERAPEAMRGAVAAHYAILSAAVEEQGGVVFKTVGDAVCAAFGEPAAAVAAGIEGQRRLTAHAWPTEIGPIEVRMAIHTGVAAATDGDYFGPTLNRVARLMSLAYPGQVIVSHASTMLLSGGLPPGVQLRDLGVFRLKDLSEPEPTAQVVADGLRPEFPPLASLDARPNNLPFQIASFVGRESELREIQEQLGTRRLITIVGPGGIGKTRLALQAAAESADKFSEGTWFADLSSVTDAALIAQAIAVVLNVREEPQRPLDETLADEIGAKRMIIVLDGVDRVLTGAAMLVKKLLSRCPSLQIIATSREPLHVTGERIERIGAILEAPQLFLERAREISPDAFRYNDESEAIADICRRLDGIPLAIELAAAQVTSISLRELSNRLHRSMKLLVSRDPTKDERHRTLRAAIAWSFDLLPKPEATALCDLSVFEGSFTISAAAAVLDDDEYDTITLITELSIKSMLAIVGGAEPARYSMMSTIREYLRDVTTDTGLANERSRRHFQFFKDVVAPDAQAADSDASVPLEVIDSDSVNIRAALAWGIEKDPASAAAMAVALSRYWKARGFFSEGRAYFAQLLSKPSPGNITQARLLRRAASFAIEHDDYDEAREMNAECRRIYEELGDVNGVAETLFTAAVIEQRLGHADIAKKYYPQAITSFRHVSNPRGEALALHNLVLLALADGDLVEAETRIGEAVDVLKRARDDVLGAHFAGLRGRLATKRGDFLRAETHYRQALDVQLREGNRLDAAVVHSELAIVLVQLRRYAEACESARLCLNTGLEIDSAALLIYGFEAFCEIDLELQRYESAARCFALAEMLRESHYGCEAVRDMVAIEATLRSALGPRFESAVAEVRGIDVPSAAAEVASRTY